MPILRNTEITQEWKEFSISKNTELTEFHLISFKETRIQKIIKQKMQNICNLRLFTRLFEKYFRE